MELKEKNNLEIVKKILKLKELPPSPEIVKQIQKLQQQL